MARLPFGGQAGSGGAPAAPPLLELIERFKQVGVATTKTFTFTDPDFDKTAYLMLTYDLIFADNAADLQMRVNAKATADYRVAGRKISGGVETLLNISAVTSLPLLQTANFSANSELLGMTKIYLNRDHNDRPYMLSELEIAGPVSVVLAGDYSAALGAGLTSITIFGPEWKEDSMMRLYKVIDGT